LFGTNQANMAEKKKKETKKLDSRIMRVADKLERMRIELNMEFPECSTGAWRRELTLPLRVY